MNREKFIKETTTIKDLKQAIKTLPDNMLVYLSIDSEGNGFSTISKDAFQSMGISYEDNACIIYPYAEGYDYPDIMPKDFASMELDNE